MQILSAKVRINGDRDMEIHKGGLTPAEISVLQHIHGHDSVNDVQVEGEEERKNRDERARLESIYGAPRVAEVFAGSSTPLPQEYEEAAPAGDDDAADLTDEDNAAASTVTPAPRRGNPDALAKAREAAKARRAAAAQ